MLRVVLFTALLASSALADYDAGSSYTSYQNQPQIPSYTEPLYSYPPTGNSFYAPSPFSPFLGWGIDWNQALSTAAAIAMIGLLIGGVVLVLDGIASYYTDFDSDLVFRALDSVNIPELSQVVNGIEKLHKMYGESLKTVKTATA